MEINSTIFSMADYIQKHNDFSTVAESTAFESYKMITNIQVVDRLLLNAWSAEYALRITPAVNGEQYLRSALSWTFPQAYYAVLFSTRAFLASQGVHISNENYVSRRISALVKKGFYPSSLSFYAKGAGDTYKLENIAKNEGLVQYIEAARLKRIHEAIRDSPNITTKAIREHGFDGIVKGLPDTELQALAEEVGSITFFNLLSMLRFSREKDIDAMIQEYESSTTLDMVILHNRLLDVVKHVNAVHELYIAKALGYGNFKAMVNKLPEYLRTGFVNERFESVIVPVLLGTTV